MFKLYRNYRPMTAFKYTSMTIVGALSLIMLSRGIANADELIVRVNNIKEAGEIHIAIYDSVEAFEATAVKKVAQHRASRKERLKW